MNLTVCISKITSRGGKCRAISVSALFGYKKAPVNFMKAFCHRPLNTSRFFHSHRGAAYISLVRIMVFQRRVKLLMFNPWFLFVLFVISPHFLVHSIIIFDKRSVIHVIRTIAKLLWYHHFKHKILKIFACGKLFKLPQI